MLSKYLLRRPAQLQKVTFGWIEGADCANARPIERASKATVLDFVPCIVGIWNKVRSRRRAVGFQVMKPPILMI
jgi:hypothetical protein